MDLRANAIITAVDRFSGPVGRMAGALNALTTVSNRAGAIAQSARRVGQAMTGPMAIGLGAVIASTQEFEKKALGLRIATIADAMDRFGNIDHSRIARDAEALKQSSLATSEMLGVSPTGLIEAAEAAAKMGIALKQADAIMRTSAILNMIDPEVGYGTSSELLGTLGLQFRAPQGAEDYAKWITATGDKVAMTASATRTSVGRIQDGLRQFSGVFATFGASVDQTLAVLGGMVQGGLLDEESGTALKSAALRFIKPTFEGLSSMTAIGIDRRKYMDLTGADPYRATNQLMRMFTGYLGKDEKSYLLDELQKAQKEGKGADPEFIDRIAAYINKRTGSKETLEDTYLKVLNTITSSGGRVDIYKYLDDIAQKVKDGEISDSQLATIFEGRHIARMKTLFNMWDGQVERLLDILNRTQGQGLDAALQEYQGSAFGRWEMALASLSRAAIRLRESEGITSLVNSLGNLASAIASMPKGAIEAIGYTVAALGGLAVGGLALSGISTAVAAIAGALGLLAAIPAAPVLAIATAIGALGAAFVGWDAIASTLQNASKVLGETFDTISSAISGFMSKVQSLVPDWLNPFKEIPPEKRYDPSRYSQGVNRDGSPRGMIRDIDPMAGPTTVDVTGKVDANVQGTVSGRVDVNVDVKVEGGAVTDKRVSGGELTGSLKKGKTMPDTAGP
ncbi:MAG: phage tail tape measure protein [Hyphomicrobium zavarzinii]|uniref:phage tail tape measure protein n=1 Tax=Hyphomicrobium zavarzinii TaxID=48292 RepID=UPI001A4A713E|nr:phage tail tape measure protein [Hyphomicrobium zavarzinii]MBL8844813.1 phage tail tape measure protein [Hyphomicrobium zavarzinii]